MGIFTTNKSVKSPVSKYLSWKSAENCFEYYDKEVGAKVPVKLPLTFIALDDFVGVSGGEMDDKGNFWPVTSGIVAHLGKALVVKKAGETVAQGKWKDIKDVVKAAGGRYTSYTYALLNDELVCFKLSGAALSAWFNKKEGDKITVKKSEKMKKGGISYNSPVFEVEALSEKEMEKTMASNEVEKFQEYKDAKEKQTTPGEDEETPAVVEETMPDLSDEEDEIKMDLV